VTRALIHGFLAEGGYEVAEADDGASALLLMARRRFSLILLDLNMPMIDGLKLLEIMAEKGLSTPTICLTALAGEQQEIKGFKLGAVDFMRKPIQKDVLLMRVRNVLRARDLAPTG
jgi:DNA-binding response OmpR family regulator